MNTQKFKAGTTIRKILLDTPSIASVINNNIYPIIAPDNTSGSFIIYQRDQYSKERTKQGVYNEICVIYLTVVCEGYEESQKLAIEIDKALEAYTEAEIRLTDSTEDFAEGKYIQVLKFEIE